MPHMLIVDDDFVDQCAIVRALDDHPHVTFRCAGDAREGLDYLERHDVDIVIADIRMPGMDGYQFRDKVWLKRPMLPLILMTGGDVETTSPDEIRRGAQPVLAKRDINKHFIPLCEMRLPRFIPRNN